MKTITATELKKHSGEHLDAAVHGPVLIQKTRRPFAVLLSFSEFERLRACEDTYWVARALEARQEGTMGVKATNAYIKSRLETAGPATHRRTARNVK
jgi:prevent-host-death family protein